ncbi:hypothetical protein Y032_0722g1838 [Ancylostoma ceylanicum]|uniref:Uncharacterized protein n=1 Tax=Ancylostoma ceylanicum TaxID=53326 RepID=A0A016WGF0_9BILA|nr:hypothetical protein Y032_0722g1838 [Ancylostoma ceylanicum]
MEFSSKSNFLQQMDPFLLAHRCCRSEFSHHRSSIYYKCKLSSFSCISHSKSSHTTLFRAGFYSARLLIVSSQVRGA